MKAPARLAAVIVTELIAAGGVLVLAGRSWQTISAPRPRPLADEVLPVSGRSLEPAVTALGLVALAGVVAVLATRGWARRVVGVLIALTGAGLAWRSLNGLTAVPRDRALSLLHDAHTGVGLDPGVPLRVQVHAVWPALAGVCGLLVLATGALFAWRGPTWSVLSSRYDAPQSPTQQAQADATLWSALDRGEDPTSRTES